MVYKVELKNTVFKRNTTTGFKSIYTKEERDKIIEIYSRGREMNLFNGCAIRLDSLENEKETSVINLSKVCFYDLLVTNVLNESYESIVKKCITNSEKELVNRLINRLNKDATVESIDDILNKDYLSNILAVSIVMQDLNGDILLVQRGENVAVCAGIMGVSVTGVLDECDYEVDNPFVNCAIREVKEELAVDVKSCNVHVHSLVAGEHKMQPVVLCDIRYEGYFEELIQQLDKAQDFYKENKKCIVMSRDEVKRCIDDFIMTEAGKEHLNLFLAYK